MKDKAVSPVIGVILMIAIVVILAAVIAALISGMAGTVEQRENQGCFLFSGCWQEENRTIRVIDRTISDSGHYWIWDASGAVYKVVPYGLFSMLTEGDYCVRIRQPLTEWREGGYLYYIPEIVRVYPEAGGCCSCQK